MKIDELNRIKTIKLSDILAGAEEGTGTFAEILDETLREIIIPVLDDYDNIIGMHHKTDPEVDDDFEALRFENRYKGLPIDDWFLKSLKLKADGLKATDTYIVDVGENGNGIKVILETGEPIIIEEAWKPASNLEVSGDCPDTVVITRDICAEMREELNLEVDDDIYDYYIEKDCYFLRDDFARYLRHTYGRYLSGKCEKDDQFYITVEPNEDNTDYNFVLSDIKWGRRK